ncbi:MAG: 1-acyl-sn-glycerol-3-phosphate acyltransferase [Alphaproteobacteria bacterium]|nr:1-acyl-sn-glycerol-3-phosphate acyltransferase [Alphaproteobacteria bacterium]MDE2629536.1 1-acyl-sn-glycerol-3-phosphate acyltransferase [Alphaproteobacteria bacterium]
MTLLRSVLFFLWFAAVSAAIHIAALPALLLPRRVTVWASRRWSEATLWGLKILAGLDFEVRGEIPTQAVLVAAKHMSMWDTVALYLLLYDPAVVVKRELLRVPFYGWYLQKAGVIAIDRGGHASALRQMAQAARLAIGDRRSILIFPEGTRKKPGSAPDYKPGAAGLYNQLQVPCVPVALNSGLFWTGFLKKRGRIVIEFLPAIPAGLKRAEFMRTLEECTEAATARLIAEGRKRRLEAA